ncbi:glycoside hydrolase 43 family protein [Sphingobium sp.]|uniref:glycoside hydrolase family 43 protein n=1 Tax=Sphingobium sp. TaxID=1912891 RepID=UPI002BEA311F|nr:glycoside hydrolase 43 family protein [Sphingobium sp.]HUD90606.1 glycoside hydrolase 43 family protein [Sphingobium sp.]
MLRTSSLSLAVLAACLIAGASAGVGAGEGRWIPDQGDGTYSNPVLAGDYSDPDAVRVGDDFYLVSSSFTDVPGLPILHSRDLVNWTLIGHALGRVPPDDHYRTARRGGGVWAPAIRYRDGRFVIYYPDPDRGIFMVSATDPKGPWSEPVLVDSTTGAIDPAPFWDDDGTGWLAYAFAKSRAGKANLIALKRLNAAGTRTEGPERIVIDAGRMPKVATSLGPRPWQTTEGPKLYKRDGWYYVFVPSGSVKGGWQGVFRSRRITGPYEGRNVMDQGGTAINGPHQGAWVDTPGGEDWFLHFQDRDAYGRIVHLQPMRWKDGWPVIGMDNDGDGRGEPVLVHRKPGVATQPVAAPVADDAFDQGYSLAWQFGSNPGSDWASVEDGWLRLKSVTGSADLYETGAVLSQKLPGPAFCASTLMRFAPLRVGERAGLAVHGVNFAWIGLENRAEGIRVVQVRKDDERPGIPITETAGPVLKQDRVWLRACARPVMVDVPPPDFAPYWPSMLRDTRMAVRFAYSLDGMRYEELGSTFEARQGRWVGAQIGLFAQAAIGTPAAVATSVGYAQYDWWKIGE